MPLLPGKSGWYPHTTMVLFGPPPPTGPIQMNTGGGRILVHHVYGYHSASGIWGVKYPVPLETHTGEAGARILAGVDSPVIRPVLIPVCLSILRVANRG